MNGLIAFLASPAGQAVISMAASSIYPEVVDAVKAGENVLAAAETQHPLIGEAFKLAAPLINAILPGVEPDHATVTAFIKGALGTLSASDPTISGTVPVAATTIGELGSTPIVPASLADAH